MKRDTRRAILDMAKTLFSQQGYNAVSIGEIAGALGISKGNVTYHFKRKEDIMEALLAEAKPTFFQEPPRTMEELDAFLEDMEQARENYAFYFQHHAQLGQLSPRSGRGSRRFITASRHCLPRRCPFWPVRACFEGRIFPGRMPVWRIPFSSPPFTGFPSVRSRGGRRISGPRPGLCCIPC